MQLFESLNSRLMTKPRLPHALNKSPSVRFGEGGRGNSGSNKHKIVITLNF